MEITRTVTLKCVEPTAHKHRKLSETKSVYQEALRAAFDADCATMSEVNDVVTEYELSGYAKNALKRYVPQLCGESYDANELDDDHPIRFTNEGIRLDHKPENEIEWYVKIPHHEDYSLWIPAQPNPEQRGWLEAIHAGNAKMGESRLLDRGGHWDLHIVCTRNVQPSHPSDSVSETPIGVDIGEATLVTVCHRDERGSPTAPTLWSAEGKQVRHLRKTYFTMSRRLQKRASGPVLESCGEVIWRRIDDIIHTVTSEVVNAALRLNNPVLILEDLTHIQENAEYGAFMNRRLHGWAFAKIHHQIRYKSEGEGIPVKTVNPAYSSKKCHECGEKGYRPDQATFRCTSSDCSVSEFHADINAALRHVDRYRNGESHSREHPGDDDSVADGACLTAPQGTQADAETQQMTTGTNAP